jgi:hypothetical protein
MLGVVDVLLLGRLSAAIDAVALANMWGWATMSLGMGVVMGMDPPLHRRSAMATGEGAALALQRGSVVALAVGSRSPGHWQSPVRCCGFSARTPKLPAWRSRQRRAPPAFFSPSRRCGAGCPACAICRARDVAGGGHERAERALGWALIFAGGCRGLAAWAGDRGVRGRDRGEPPACGP